MLSVSVVILTQGTRNEDLHHIWADVLGQTIKPKNIVTVINCETVDLGKVPAGSQVQYAGRSLRVSGYGSVVFGIGRDAVETAATYEKRNGISLVS